MALKSFVLQIMKESLNIIILSFKFTKVEIRFNSGRTCFEALLVAKHRAIKSVIIYYDHLVIQALVSSLHNKN